MSHARESVPFVNLDLLHQPIQAELEDAVRAVLQRGDFILGQAVREFESAFSTACGASYGVGLACGTDAISVGLQACGVKAGDEVILPANTFIATLMGVLQAGATPILVDCDPETALIDLDAASKAVTSKTKAIVPVHLYGQMVSPQALSDFADRHHVIVFEDAAQAHLAQREGVRPGAVGAAAAFSFYPSKNLGAFGDGGILVTRDEAIAQKARTLRNYGAPKKYIHVEVGKNSRLDSIQAAVLNTKLPYLEQWNRDRNTAAAHYDRLLDPLGDRGITPMQNHSGTGHVYHLYVIRIDELSPLKRDIVQQELDRQGIQTGIHYPIPCHLQPGYKHLGYQSGDFPHAETLCEQILSLPMFPGLQLAQIERVVEAIETTLSRQLSGV